MAVGISHVHAHEETIELRLGQRIRSMMLDRVLRGDHKKRLRQLVADSVDRNLALVHGLEQRRLSLWSGTVDFVGQQNVGKHRPAFEFEFLLCRRIYGNTENVGRQHIAGELYPLKAASESASKGSG